MNQNLEQFQDTSEYLNHIIKAKRYSMGKLLRKPLFQNNSTLQEIQVNQKNEKQLPSLKFPEKTQQYLDFMQEKGLIYDKKLFKPTLLNEQGLSIITLRPILQEQEIARIPRSIMLDTQQAYQSGIQSIFKENLFFFAPDGFIKLKTIFIRVLLLYLLYEYQKQEKSEYYHMINNFPKHVNIAAFWDKQVLEKLKDEYLLKQAIKQCDFFNHIYTTLSTSIIPKYKKYFPNPVQKETLQWLYTHIITRTFGITEYVTFVPFAEWMNHGYVSSYGQFNQENQQTDNAQQSHDQDYISDDSYTSSDFSTKTCDYDQNYFDPPEQLIKEYTGLSINILSCMGTQNLQENQANYQIQISPDDRMAIQALIMDFINEFDLGVNFNALIFAKILEKLKKIEQKPEILKENLSRFEKMMTFIKFLIESNEQKRKPSEDNYNHKVFKGLKPKNSKQWDIDQEQKIAFLNKEECDIDRYSEYESVTKLNPLIKDHKQKKFEWFSLKIFPKLYYHKRIQTGAQLYYQYGRLSNQQFLLRYGFALENNKYESVYVKVTPISCSKNIKEISTEALIYLNHFKVKNTEVNFINDIKTIQSFKLKYTQFCHGLLMFCRGLFWKIENNLESLFKPIDLNLETLALKKMKQYLIKEIREIIDDEPMVKIYQQEKNKVIRFNIEMVELAIKLIEQKPYNEIQKLLEEQNKYQLKIMGLYIKDILKA